MRTKPALSLSACAFSATKTPAAVRAMNTNLAVRMWTSFPQSTCPHSAEVRFSATSIHHQRRAILAWTDGDVLKWERRMVWAASVVCASLDRDADESRGMLRTTARGFGFAILLLFPSFAAAQDFPPQFQLAPVTEAPQ